MCHMGTTSLVTTHIKFGTQHTGIQLVGMYHERMSLIFGYLEVCLSVKNHPALSTHKM